MPVGHMAHWSAGFATPNNQAQARSSTGTRSSIRPMGLSMRMTVARVFLPTRRGRQIRTHSALNRASLPLEHSGNFMRKESNAEVKCFASSPRT